MIDTSDFGMYNCTSCGFVKIRLNIFGSSPCGRCGGVVDSGSQQVKDSLGGIYGYGTRTTEGPDSPG